MSEEREKVEKLIERTDELLIILGKVVEDLQHVSMSLRSFAVSKITEQPTASTSVPMTLEPSEQKTTIEDLKIMFPENLENLLSFEEKEDYIVIRPRQFLGSENFAKIASTIRGAGGDYISAGKKSHFRIPKGKR